jgi:hypothetical protein
MTRALFFCARWALASALLNTSASLARLARKMASPPRQAYRSLRAALRGGLFLGARDDLGIGP